MLTNSVENENLKATIKEHYSRIARENGEQPGCCETTTSCCGSESTSCMAEEYNTVDMKNFGAANLGLGCGLPTEYAGIREGMTVLDLGSGAGFDAFIASTSAGAGGKVIGLDMTEAMIDRARRNAISLGISNVEFHTGEIERMPFAPDSFDRILSNCVLNLVPDKSKAFSEMYRVLKQGGMFAVSDIVTVGAIPEKVRNDRALWAGCIAGAMNRDTYLELIARAGFHRIEIMQEKPYPGLTGEGYALLSVTIRGTK